MFSAPTMVQLILCVAVGGCGAKSLLGASRVSLRLGRSAALTTHCVVIHYRLNRRALQRLPYVFTEAEESLPLWGRGTALAVDEGNLYHSFYGMRCQFYVMQFFGISRRVEDAAPYKVAIKFL